ncbi:hypothetical protein Tco_1069472 [Tanacetum coccineum]|uniref:Integrase zinc-binding domain-containing protein n=1 Tax=Tanacetum coccineum TaxID=301880 RepID=A0ABQ5HIK6_9ASTR
MAEWALRWRSSKSISSYRDLWTACSRRSEWRIRYSRSCVENSLIIDGISGLRLHCRASASLQFLEVGSIRRIQGLDMAYWGFLRAQIRRIFLDGYGVLVFRIVIFKISSFKLQNACLLLIFTNYTTLFDVITNLLRESLEITPIDQAHQFVSPPAGDAITGFVNKLGYTEEIYFVSRMAVNNPYQPWREILSMINQCLTCQTYGYDRPKYPVLQMLWKGKKTKPRVIPYCRFTKLIICYLGRTHNIHQRSASPFHLAEEDHRLGNLTFVPKGEDDEVFGMQIPKELITDNIRSAPYYNAYLEMVAKHDQKIAAEKGGKKKSASKVDQSKKPTTAKQSKLVSTKQSKPAPAKKPKVAQEKPSEPSPAKQSKKGKVGKVRKGKSPLKIIDEDEEVHHEPVPQGKGEEYDVERAIQMSLESFQAHGQALVGGVAFRKPMASGITQNLPVVEGKGKGITTDELAAYEADIEILSVGEERPQDPGKSAESRPPPEHEVMKKDQVGSNPGLSHVALAGPDPEPMHDDFVATVYPQMKHLEINSSTTNQRKNLEKQMWKLKSNLWSLSPFIKRPQHLLHSTTATTTITLPLLPPPQQQISSDPDLASRVSALEQVCANFKKRHKLQDKTVQGLSSSVFTLELRDLPHKIGETVNEAIKEVVQIALQAPLKERFRDLSEADMKEILHDRMDEFLREKDKSRKRLRVDQDPPPPPTKESEQSNKKKRHDSDASGSKQPPAPHIPDDVNVSDSEDIDIAHHPKIKTRQDWLKPVPEEDRLETPKPDWVIPPNDLPNLRTIGPTHLLTRSGYQQKDRKPSQNNKTEHGVSQERRNALSISKLKAAYYPDFRLEELVPSLWIESELEYDVSATYGITHWWFKRKEFYITRHSAPSNRGIVRSYMRIFSVISLKTYERYSYTFLKEIVLRRADYNEYTISEADFKNLQLNDFEYLYLLHLQGQLNHLSRADKVHLFNAINLWIRNIVIRKRVEDL